MISTYEKRDGQIMKLITEAESLQKSSPDHGTVHDERVAEPTQVDDLIVADAEEKVKSIFDLGKGWKRKHHRLEQRKNRRGRSPTDYITPIISDGCSLLPKLY